MRFKRERVKVNLRIKTILKSEKRHCLRKVSNEIKGFMVDPLLLDVRDSLDTGYEREESGVQGLWERR